MRQTIEAHKKFVREHPYIKLSPTTFNRWKPKHIKSVSKTPLNACQCVYCTNVNEKLKVLCIPGLNNEQDVYKTLICKKTRRFRNQKCIFQICTRCKNWENKLNLLACKLDMKKIVT